MKILVIVALLVFYFFNFLIKKELYLPLNKPFVCAQIKTKLRFENGITADLKGLLGDNKERTITSLKLIKYIVRFRKSCKLYLNYDDDFVMGLYLKLHKYARSDFEEIVCDCMTIILRDNEQLAFLAVTSVFMEMQCECPDKNTYTRQFIRFFELWFQVLKAHRLCSFPYRLLENFVLRAPQSMIKNDLNFWIWF